MTDTDLQRELERIASAAPTAHVPADLYARGRRAHRRDLALVGAAVVVVIAAVAALVVRLPGAVEPPIATDESALGVPDHLYAVPTDAVGDATDNAAVGTAAVAWATDDGTAVLVDARTGSYHLVDLPGAPHTGTLLTPLTMQLQPRPVALDPSGNLLAYVYGETDDGPHGVRVIDLRDGSVVEDVGIKEQVVHVTWSPAGTWILWRGDDWFTQGRPKRQNTEVAGRILLGSGSSSAVEVPRDSNHTFAIDDAGVVTTLTTSTLTLSPPPDSDLDLDRLEYDIPPGRLSSAVWGPHGQLLLGVGSDGPDDRPPSGTFGRILTPYARQGRAPYEHLLPADWGPERNSEAVGWVQDAPLVAFHDRDGHVMQVVMDPSDAWPTTVVTAETLVPTNLSIATDLMTKDRPSVTRTKPDFPWSVRPFLVPTALALSLTAVAVLGLVICRRRRASRGYPRWRMPRTLWAGMLVAGVVVVGMTATLLGPLHLTHEFVGLSAAGWGLLLATGVAIASRQSWRRFGVGLAVGTLLTVGLEFLGLVLLLFSSGE